MNPLEILIGEARSTEDWVRYSALARKAARLLASDGAPASLRSARVALLGGPALDAIEKPLLLALLEKGIAADLLVAPYDLYYSELTDPGSATANHQPSIAIVLLTSRNVPRWPSLDATVEEAQALAAEVVTDLLDACERLHRRCGAEIILGTFPMESADPHGNLGAKLPGDRNNFLRRLNLALGDRAPSFVHLDDVASLAARHGLVHWFDPRLWYSAKQAVTFTRVPALVRNIAAIAGALLGTSRKVLAVDLDNTLWGGVVGDDGLEGIDLGEGSPTGEAYKALQTYLRALEQRGVLLVAVTKNDLDTALLPLRAHPETVLRPEHFAAIKANWRAKSDNLAELARELDLGLDAFVFLDDNPAERDEIRQALPEVAVIELGEDPADTIEAIERGRYFEPVAVTREDRSRSELYRRRDGAKAIASTARDLSEFLDSLEMRAVIRPFEPISMSRIVQLIHKTNQFNLTTWRTSAAEVEQIASDPRWIHRSVRLSDRFGDHGLISVFMGRIDGDVLSVENWLMSCRVFKRGVERLLLDEIVKAVRERGVRSIRGRYLPTPKNEIVRDLYAELHFTRIPDDGTATYWQLDVEKFIPLVHHIDQEEVGADAR